MRRSPKHALTKNYQPLVFLARFFLYLGSSLINADAPDFRPFGGFDLKAGLSPGE
ncbi:hypothetical protein SAMN04490243_1508 [Robiginitalea myxolifaciens]|uniref:Uncharacterized protein n=1 Tax=Robiginitalea myxolifaciens TaxID=400055 RepID=A0A1I6GAX9_9FLAO|nr:hypothetical protein SAMN04490243_1508 [Robiginitalea myxolifaciens]